MQDELSKENTFQGNAIPWEDWEKGARLAGLDPYHAHIGGEEFSEEITKDLKPPVLDAGCGWGGLLTYIDGKAVGIDVSPYCVKKAKDLTSDVDGVRIYQSDIFDIEPISIGTFNSVISLDVLPLISDKSGVICKFSDVLSPKGVILATDYFASKEFAEIFSPYGGAEPCTEQEYHRAFEEAGLLVDHTEDLSKDCSVKTSKVISNMKQDPLKTWIQKRWSKDYYKYALGLSKEWSQALREREIRYVLIKARHK